MPNLFDWTFFCAGGHDDEEEITPKDVEEDLNEVVPGSIHYLKASIKKPSNASGLGLTFDITEGSHVQICDIRPGGCVANYNSQAPEELQIRPGDFLLFVNGKKASKDCITREVSSNRTVQLEISRPDYWEVALTKKTTESYGFACVAAQSSKFLVVTKVQSGPILEWNASHPNKVVKVGDRIMSINGAVGMSADEMLASLKHSTSVNFLMTRPKVS